MDKEELEAISEVEWEKLNKMERRCDLLEIESKRAELEFKSYLVELREQYRLGEGDQINRRGFIIRKLEVKEAEGGS